MTVRAAARCPCRPDRICGRALASIWRIRQARPWPRPLSAWRSARERGSLSSLSAIASAGSLQISRPAVVLVARQSKFGSLRIAIRSSGFLQQAGLDRMRISDLAMLCRSNMPQLRVAAPDPFDVFLDRHPAIGDPAQPLLDRGVQPHAGGVQFGIAAEQLLGLIPEIGATVLVEQRQRRRGASGRLRACLRRGREAPTRSGIRNRAAIAAIKTMRIPIARGKSSHGHG